MEKDVGEIFQNVSWAMWASRPNPAWVLGQSRPQCHLVAKAPLVEHEVDKG